VTGDDEARLQRLRDLQRVLGSAWLADVLVVLSSGPRYRSDLLQAVRSAHAADGRVPRDVVVDRTLQRMERYELLGRERLPTFPFRVSYPYRLSPTAVALLDALAPALAWAGEHADLIERAR
jgi:DNA-binding HxlR family transcriptional regulator